MMSSLFVCTVDLKRCVAVSRGSGVKWGLKTGEKATDSIRSRSSGAPVLLLWVGGHISIWLAWCCHRCPQNCVWEGGCTVSDWQCVGGQGGSRKAPGSRTCLLCLDLCTPTCTAVFVAIGLRHTHTHTHSLVTTGEHPFNPSADEKVVKMSFQMITRAQYWERNVLFSLSAHWCSSIVHWRGRPKQSRALHGCVGAFSLASESWTLKMERESGPERGGLFLCRLQPLTERECLLLCQAASHSGSSWRMKADTIVPVAGPAQGEFI